MSTLISFVLVLILIILAFKFLGVLAGIGSIILVLLFLFISRYPYIMVGRGNAEFNKKNYEKALAYYKKAYSMKNRKFVVDVSYAQALMRTGHLEEALQIMNDLLKINVVDNVKMLAKQTRSIINYKLGNIDEAYEEAYELFYDENFVNGNLYALLGLLMLVKNCPLDETLDFCLKGLDHDDENRDILDNLQVCYTRMGEYEKALEITKNITEKYPDFVEGWYHGAVTYSLSGDKKSALSYAEHIKDCTRTFMTTVSEEDVESLIKSLK